MDILNNDITIYTTLEKLADFLCDDASLLNFKQVEENIKMGSSDKASKEMRSIAEERLFHLVNNAGIILFGALIIPEYRDLCRDCLWLEAHMENYFPKKTVVYMRSLTDRGYNNSGSKVTFDTKRSLKNNDMFYELKSRFWCSFPDDDEFKAEFCFAIEELSLADRKCISYLISNFHYLFRAYAHNDDFYDKTVILINTLSKKIYETPTERT